MINDDAPEAEFATAPPPAPRLLAKTEYLLELQEGEKRNGPTRKTDGLIPENITKNVAIVF